jgi:FkbM family methyltransferase
LDANKTKEEITLDEAFLKILNDIRTDTEFADSDFEALLLSNCRRSFSQLFQDLWVVHQTGGKREGYFVEFGAANGVELSNTCLLETDYGWSGILAEPNPIWHAALKMNRPQSAIDKRCVYDRSGKTLEFAAPADAEYGTLVEHFSAANARAAKHEVITVETVSLNDLLETNQAPAQIDYVSVDTEGSELRILETFDFHKWDVSLFSIEHNYSAQERKLDCLMQSHGYERVRKDRSHWDAWYVKQRRSFVGQNEVA